VITVCKKGRHFWGGWLKQSSLFFRWKRVTPSVITPGDTNLSDATGRHSRLCRPLSFVLGKYVESPTSRNGPAWKVYRGLDRRLNLKPRLRHFPYLCSNFMEGEKVRNTASIFDQLQFKALWFRDESIYLKSKKCTEIANNCSTYTQMSCRSLLQIRKICGPKLPLLKSGRESWTNRQ